eukprot:4347548-Pleurochrysis_carterae.AAC.4
MASVQASPTRSAAASPLNAHEWVAGRTQISCIASIQAFLVGEYAKGPRLAVAATPLQVPHEHRQIAQ